MAVVLCVAAITTIVFQKLRQPVILGYLLAGMIVGPHIPIPIVANFNTIHILSELGVILLMFWLGLEFNLTKIVRTGPTAGLITLLECSFMLWLGYSLGRVLGWSELESFVAGAIITISSTTIIFKVFEERGMRGKITELVLSILIYEDLIAILLITILTTLATGAELTMSGLALHALRLAGFLALLIFAGLFIVPKLMRFVVRFGRPETILVFSIGVCFAVALIGKAFGYSVALGAFLAGAFISESGEKLSVAFLVRPVRDMFGAIFFVSVGMLINPVLIMQNWWLVLIFTLTVLGGKILGISFAGFITGHGNRLSIQAGMCLAQIGEFSYIIAYLGLKMGQGALNYLYTIAVSVSALTALLTPWLIKSSDKVAGLVDETLPHRLQTFASLYGSWLESLRQAWGKKTPGTEIRRVVKFLLLDFAILVAVTIGASQSMEWFVTTLTSREILNRPWAVGLGVSSAIIIAAPFIIGTIRCVRSLGYLLAQRALPQAEQGKIDLAAAPRRALVVMLQLTILIFVAIPFLAITQPFLPAFPGPAIFVLLVLVLAISFWRGVTNLQGHVRAGARVITEALSSQTAGYVKHYEVHDLEKIQNLLPGLGSLSQLKLDEKSYAVGKTIKDTRLRGITGASILAIVRQDDEVITPAGRDELLSGDLLVLTGTHEAVGAARRLLLEGQLPAS